MDTAIIIFLLLPNTQLFSAGPAKYRLTPMPPCEGDPVSKVSFVFTGYFNPRPLTGATRAGSPPTTGWQDFNPRPLAGATPSSAQLPPERPISIHAPMRGRPGRWSGRLVQVQFQSTPPRGGDVPLLDIVGHQIDISIHAPSRGRRPGPVPGSKSA